MKEKEQELDGGEKKVMRRSKRRGENLLKRRMRTDFSLPVLSYFPLYPIFLSFLHSPHFSSIFPFSSLPSFPTLLPCLPFFLSSLFPFSSLILPSSCLSVHGFLIFCISFLFHFSPFPFFSLFPYFIALFYFITS